MIRGDHQHGWSVIGFGDGCQQWSLFDDDVQISSIIIQKTGYVSDAWHEGNNYYMVMKHFEPGAPLGQKALELLDSVELEAKRRQIELPQRSLGVAPELLANTSSEKPIALANSTSINGTRVRK